MRMAIVLVVGMFLPGCLWGFPPRSRPQSVPAIVPGEEMTYKSSDFQTGVDGDGPTYGHYATGTYRGRELTQNEFQMLVDPDYPAKAKKYDSMRSACFRGNVFKFIAAFTVIGGVVSYPSLEGRTDDTTRTIVAGSLIVGGLAIGGLAYFIGGNQCAEVNELAATMGAERFDDTNLLGTFASEREVEKFNERYGIKKPASTDEPPADSPADPPADE